MASSVYLCPFFDHTMMPRGCRPKDLFVSFGGPPALVKLKTLFLPLFRLSHASTSSLSYADLTGPLVREHDTWCFGPKKFSKLW